MSVVVEPNVNVELPKIVSPFVDNLALVTASSANLAVVTWRSPIWTVSIAPSAISAESTESAANDVERVTFPEPFITNMLAVMDRFGSEDFTADKDSEQVRTMKNYLATVNDQMTGVVSDFVRRNFSKQHATFLDCIQNLIKKSWSWQGFMSENLLLNR